MSNSKSKHSNDSMTESVLSSSSTSSSPSTPPRVSRTASSSSTSGNRQNPIVYRTPIRNTTKLIEPDSGNISTATSSTIAYNHQSLLTDIGSSSSSRPRCLVGCSGSVATLKIPELVVELSKFFEVLVVCTTNSSFFLKRAEEYNKFSWSDFERIGGWNVVLQDSDEWEMWNKIGHDVLHIELRRWADVFVVAPASANTISKASVGICDNLLLSIMRAWDFDKPCVICPAMNTFMWDHPATNPAINTLKSWGWQVLGPVEKMLACKEVGNGAMTSVDSIVLHLLSLNITPNHGSSPASHEKNSANRKAEATSDLSKIPKITENKEFTSDIKSQEVLWNSGLDSRSDIQMGKTEAVKEKIKKEKGLAQKLIVGLSLLLIADISIRWVRHVN